MRVLWVIKGLGPGGAERLLVAAAGAHNHGAFTIECAYVLPFKDHLADDLERAGVRTRCLSRTRRDPMWPVRLERLIRTGEFDVVHFHSPLTAGVGRLAARRIRSPHRPALVSTEHNPWGTFSLPTRLLNRATAPFDDACFAVSEETRQSMGRRTASRCRALVHGIDVSAVGALTAHRAEARRELGVADDVFVVGTVANFRAQKDYPTLLRAAVELRRRDPSARVVAIGQGPLERETRQLATDLGIDDTVIFTGWRPDATRLMAGFDAFTLASLYEGLPVALMEASALGLPIIATRVGGVAEALTDDDAVLVPKGSPTALAAGWLEVAGDGARRTDLAEASKGLADRFDARRAIAEYESCYSKLIGKPAPPQVDTSNTGPRHRPVDGVTIRPAGPDDRPAILALLIRSLGWKDDPRHAQLFSWKHDENPFGPSPMWVACEGERIVGLRVFMRWQFRRGGQVLRAVRAVDTATDPAYQGRGLFTALTLHGLDALTDDGIDFVFNTPNDQSLPGYLKMGWRQIGAVPASVRVRNARSLRRTLSARTPADLWSSPLDIGVPAEDWLRSRGGRETPPPDDPRAISTNQTADYLRWRYSMPTLRYRAVAVDDGAVIVRQRRRGEASELVVAEAVELESAQVDAAVGRILEASGSDHALRTGGKDIRHGFLPLPGGGPMLTFRPLSLRATPPAANWRLSLGDVELF